MGRSQVAFNHRARGRGRGRGGGGGGRGTGGRGRVESASPPPSKQPQRQRPAVVNNHQQPDIHDEQNDLVDDAYNTLDDRAEQLLSYGTATSTGVAQFQPLSDHDEGEIIMFQPSALLQRHSSPSTSKMDNVAEQMNRLNQRLALLPFKDRLRLPDFILAEMMCHDDGTPAHDKDREEEKASSVLAVVAPQVAVEKKVKDDNVNNNATAKEKEEEEEENLDDWLDSVIQ